MSSQHSKEIFAKNLRKLLDARGMQDKDLMGITGASQTAISEWLNGKKFPRIDKIERIAAFFSVPKSSLIEDETDIGRRMVEQEIAELIHSLPDTYKLAALDYLRFLLMKAKEDRSQSVVPPSIPPTSP